MKNVIWLYLFICISTLGLKANDLQITNLSFSDVNNTITFDVQWDNSWHDATGNFHDAVWVFVKYRTPGSQWKHANILFSGTPPTGMSIVTPVDRKGAFIRRSTQGLGNVAAGTYKFNIINSLGVNPSFKVFGVEMV
ncbi:MAG: hypothetical protein HKN68_10155, partial [Saprospiraceae bacterium]|nr:hypothetical protein [Saprospiraceae bacterium]